MNALRGARHIRSHFTPAIAAGDTEDNARSLRWHYDTFGSAATLHRFNRSFVASRERRLFPLHRFPYSLVYRAENEGVHIGAVRTIAAAPATGVLGSKATRGFRVNHRDNQRPMRCEVTL